MSLSLTVKHSHQKSGGECVWTFSFWTFLQSPCTNNICKLLQFAFPGTHGGLPSLKSPGIEPQHENSWRGHSLQCNCDTNLLDVHFDQHCTSTSTEANGDKSSTQHIQHYHHSRILKTGKQELSIKTVMFNRKGVQGSTSPGQHAKQLHLLHCNWMWLITRASFIH